MDARVSVLIPAYNSTFIEDTIASVYAQTVLPGEVIVVNDGSTDDTEARLRHLAARLPANFVIRTKENGGCASALNLGLRLATGMYIAFLDHDDIWHPEKLERQLADFERYPGSALSFTDHSLLFANPKDAIDVLYRGPDGEPRAVEVPPEPWLADAESVLEIFLTSQCPVPTMSTVMMRRDVLASLGPFDEELDTGHDVKMYLDLLATGGRIEYVPRRLVQYRCHGENLSRDGVANRSYMWQIADRFYELHAADLTEHMRDRARGWRARAHLLTAIDAIRQGETGQARRHILKAARIRPSSVRPGWLRMLGVGAPPG